MFVGCLKDEELFLANITLMFYICKNGILCCEH